MLQLNSDISDIPRMPLLVIRGSRFSSVRWMNLHNTQRTIMDICSQDFENASTTVNPNAGTCLLTKKLPGNVAPGQGFQVNRNRVDIDNELSLPDTLSVICSSDSQAGASEGGETFTITGLLPQQRHPFASNQGGNPGTTLASVANANNLVPNFFENFTSNLPDDWTIVAGSAGTDFKKETTQVMTGLASLACPFGLTFTLSFNVYPNLTPSSMNCLFFYIKRVGSSTGTITLTVTINGSVAGTKAVTISSAHDTDWKLESVIFDVPADLGLDDGTTHVRIAGAVTGAGVAYVDGGCMALMTQHAGMGFCITQGDDKYLLDDQFDVSITNDEAGKFQRFFTRAYGYQLPSVTSGQTISEPT